MNKDVPEFSTFDVDLAAFLMMSGLKFIECKIDDKSESGKHRVIMRFFDEKRQALDLERIYAGSDFARFRSYGKYLLKDIHRTLKGLK